MPRERWVEGWRGDGGEEATESESDGGRMKEREEGGLKVIKWM